MAERKRNRRGGPSGQDGPELTKGEDRRRRRGGPPTAEDDRRRRRRRAAAPPADAPGTAATDIPATDIPATDIPAPEARPDQTQTGSDRPERPARSTTVATEVTLPQLGESVTEATITAWLFEVGDTVEADQPLFELSSDKIDTEVPAPPMMATTVPTSTVSSTATLISVRTPLAGAEVQEAEVQE